MAQTRGRPSRFSRAIVAWLLAGLGFVLLSATLEGVLPQVVYLGIGWLVLAISPLVLLGVDIALGMRGRITWRSTMALVGAVIVVIAAWIPLDYLSVRLNFLLHKPIYDSVVRDAKAGALMGTSTPHGSREGVRLGVRYSYRPERPLAIYFPWKTSTTTVRAVEYRERPIICPEGVLIPDAEGGPPTVCLALPSLGDGYVFHQGII